MADLSDVRRTALSLPAAQERDSRGRAQWWVKDKMFVWERPLRPREVQELGDAAPDGPILGVRVEDLGAKEALLASEPEVFFTTSHFEGHTSVLVRLAHVPADVLEEVVTEAWLCRAPRRLAQEFLAGS